MISYIILCAGLGTRLMPITKNIPKSLVPVKDGSGYNPNIIRIIKKIKRSNKDKHKIIVVVKSEDTDKFKEVLNSIDNVEIVENPFASTTNNVTSFILGLSNINNGCIIDGTFIIDGDSYIKKDFPDVPNYSAFFTEYRDNEWGCIKNSEGIVLGFNKNYTGSCLSGITFLDCVDSRSILLELNRTSYDSLDYWESNVERFLNNLEIHEIELPKDSIMEYDNIDDLSRINGIDKTVSLIPDIKIIDHEFNSMTNTNFLVSWMKNKYVLRFPGVRSDEYTHRKEERILYESGYLKGITPDAIYLNDIKLTPFLKNARVWNSYEETEYIPDIIEKLYKIHSIKLSESQKESFKFMDPVKEVDNYLRIMNDEKIKEIEIPKKFFDMKKIFIDDLDSIHDSIINGCVTHCDLINSNVLISEKNDEVFLIDFEYTSISNPLWDLGALLSEMSIYKDEFTRRDYEEFSKFIVDEYNRLSGTNYKESDVLFWSGIVHVVWSAWAYCRSSLGTNELKYGNKRIDESEKIFKILSCYK